LGTFTAGGLECKIENGSIKIEKEGKAKKFVDKVMQVTYSGEYGAEINQDVLYITERGVFKLVKGGIELIEIAPGIDLQKDILDQMEFKPFISDDLKTMPSSIFDEPNIGLEKYWS